MVGRNNAVTKIEINMIILIFVVLLLNSCSSNDNQSLDSKKSNKYSDLEIRSKLKNADSDTGFKCYSSKNLFSRPDNNMFIETDTSLIIRNPRSKTILKKYLHILTTDTTGRFYSVLDCDPYGRFIWVEEQRYEYALFHLWDFTLNKEWQFMSYPNYDKRTNKIVCFSSIFIDGWENYIQIFDYNNGMPKLVKEINVHDKGVLECCVFDSCVFGFKIQSNPNSIRKLVKDTIVKL
jgi:hypothetical protein